MYKKNGTNWSLIGFLSPAERNANDGFGTKVSISGNWIAVTADKAAAGGVAGAGKVYLYQLNSSGTAVTYHCTLSASVPMAAGNFGRGLCMKGDTQVVGETQYTGTNSSQSNGKVYVYMRSGNNWNLQATLTATDGQKGDAFGVFC